MLGQIELRWAGQPLALATNAAKALLAYLAINDKRAHPRELLAAMFWPDHPQTAAYTNLRQTLARLRKAFPSPDDIDTFLVVTPQTLQCLPSAIDFDVARFEALLAACAAHQHPTLNNCTVCQERLIAAAGLYRGDLLHGLSLDRCQPFEEWLLLKREALHRQALDVFQTLTVAAEAAGNYRQMRIYAQRALALEPWREQAHRHVMAALVLAGECAAALAQYERCCQILDAELGIEPDQETQALRQQILTGTLAPTAPAPAAHNLLAALTPFVGREAELAELNARMQQPDLRLLSLVGLGGMGKTRLAMELGQRQLAHSADGVFLVALAPLTTAAMIVPTIAATLGVRSQNNDPHAALLQALRASNLLLILDNFEHLLDGAAVVIEILQAAPHVKIVVTSRERLNIRGEHVHLVQGLDYTSNAPTVNPSEAAAVRLFVQSARRIQPDFTLDAANLPAVLRICQTVQGMPLGLELAAIWVETLAPEAIAAKIVQQIDFLAAEWRDTPERQRSLRAVFDWSWHLLRDHEQHLLMQLSVFRGGFTLEAAQAVSGAAPPVFAALLRKSLLHQHESPGMVRRYDMHELVRQFAAERLAAAGRTNTTCDQHARYYLALLGQHEIALQQQPQPVSHTLASWLDNIRQAWQWAVEQQMWPLIQEDCFAYALLMRWVGLLDEATMTLGVAAQHLHTLAERSGQDGVTLQQSAHSLVATASRLSSLQASLLRRQWRNAEAKQVAERALHDAMRAGATSEQAFANLTLARLLASHVNVFLSQHEFQSVRTALEDVIVQCQTMDAANDRERFRFATWEVEGRQGLALLLATHSQHDAAKSVCERALQIAHTIGNRLVEEVTIHYYAQVLDFAGWFEQALDYHQQLLQAMREAGGPEREAAAHNDLAGAFNLLGLYQQAYDHAQISLQIYQRQGIPLSFVLHTISGILRSQGEFDQALIYVNQYLQLPNIRSNHLALSEGVLAQGDALFALQRFDQAACAYEHMRVLMDEAQNQAGVATAHARLAHTALAQKQRAIALEHAEQALARMDEHLPSVYLEPLRSLWACYKVLAAHDDKRATAVLQRAHDTLIQQAERVTNPAHKTAFLGIGVHAAITHDMFMSSS